MLELIPPPPEEPSPLFAINFAATPIAFPTEAKKLPTRSRRGSC